MAKANLQNNLLNFLNSSSLDACKITATDGVATLSCDSSIQASNLVQVAGVADPTTAQQVATKAYVDSSTSGAVLLNPSGTQTVANHPLNLTAGTASTSSTTGTLVVTGGVGVSGNINCGGDIECVNLSTTSDLNLKKNIRDLGTDDRFDKLRPVSFNFKDSNRLSSGLIAQEVRELYPHMVSESLGGSLSVRYLELIAVLISEVQSLKSKLK
jgi:hypothetical protein